MKKILNPKIALSLPMERYIAYLFDIVIVISITSVILSIFHFKPYIYLIFVYYRTNHHKILSLIQSYKGYVSLILFIVLLFIYFLIENFTGNSIGKFILKIKIATISNESYEKKLLRSIIKIFIPLAIIDSLFIFKSKLRQRFSDKILGYVVYDNGTIKKFPRYLLITSLFFIIPIAAQIVSILIYSEGLHGITPAPHSGIILKASMSRMHFIFLTNSSIDFTDYFLGGFSIFILEITEIIFESYISGRLIGGALISYPGFFYYGVAPQFFIEFLGYIIGMVGAIYIINVIFLLIEGYFKSLSVDFITKTLFKGFTLAIVMLIISLSILYIS
ncbi:MAG: RDD family protein, partial [Ferroplasma sp.]